jgi:hypothetical protein
MEALHKVGAVLMGIGGILVGIFGILVWVGTTVAWFEGLSFVVLAVGLLLWAIATVFGKAEVTSRASTRGQHERV